MPRQPIHTYLFALVVVRLGHRFLVVQERKHGQLWYFPGGGVEPGETIIEAALRETREEAGVPVTLDGVLRMEYTPLPGHAARCRVFFLAHPEDDTPPKSAPDGDTLAAAWVTLSEIDRLPLRNDEVRDVFRAVAAGVPVLPLAAFTIESAPWRAG